MAETQHLLVEIGTEELPPKALSHLSQHFANNIQSLLVSHHLSFSAVRQYATPRRLAVQVNDLLTQQKSENVQRKGPAIQAAFNDQGEPSKAALGFARSCGVDIEDLEKLTTDKGTWLTYHYKKEGKKTLDLLENIINQAIDKLPIPKRMRWGDSDTLFVRPVHWVVLLFGEQTVTKTILGLNSSNQSYGHRFHSPNAIPVTIENYQKQLYSHSVIADYQQRKQIIQEQIQAAANKLGGIGIAVIDEALLDEVNSMVEWPQAIVGHFDKDFLKIPTEALISSMKKHQKYFHIVDAQQQLLPYFITISNIASQNPDKIKEGNERVIRPRLADAAFFWQQDKKIPLSERVESLKSVVFQNKLGSIFDKIQRTQKLAIAIGIQLSENTQLIERACLLSKSDLMTDMVAEFPDLQGIMGYHYAIAEGEDERVAIALNEQYQPRYAKDKVAQTTIGQCLAIADRIDSIVSIFSIGQLPTGDKDPFALRRAALGVVRTIIENQLDLNVIDLLTQAVQHLPTPYNQMNIVNDIYLFIMERLRAYYLEQDIHAEIFESVLVCRPAKAWDFDQRIKAVKHFTQLEAAQSLAAANKRIANILKKIPDTIQGDVDSRLLQKDAEKNLYQYLENIRSSMDNYIAQQQYNTALTALAKLREPVDQFFDQVMVMDENPHLQHNRLCLLQQLRQQFLRIADVSML